MTLFLQDSSNTLFAPRSASKERQRGGSGSVLTIGPLHWAGIHVCGDCTSPMSIASPASPSVCAQLFGCQPELCCGHVSSPLHPQCRRARDVPFWSHQCTDVPRGSHEGQPTSAQRHAIPGVVALFESMLLILRPRMGWGREPDEHRTRDPNSALSLATLNVRRLWLQDESVLDGFHVLCNSELRECRRLLHSGTEGWCVPDSRPRSSIFVSQWNLVHSHSWCPRHCLDAVAQFRGHDMCVPTTLPTLGSLRSTASISGRN